MMSGLFLSHPMRSQRALVFGRFGFLAGRRLMFDNRSGCGQCRHQCSCWMPRFLV